MEFGIKKMCHASKEKWQMTADRMELPKIRMLGE